MTSSRKRWSLIVAMALGPLTIAATPWSCHALEKDRELSAEFLDFVADHVVGKPIHTACFRDFSVVVPRDLVGEDGRGSQCPDIFGGNHLPAAAKVVFKQGTERRVAAVSIFLFLDRREILLPGPCEHDCQVASLRLLEIHVEAVFWR